MRCWWRRRGSILAARLRAGVISCLFRNVKAILEEAGSSLAHVVKTTVFMTDVDELAALNAVYAEYFAHAPAKTGVEVKRLRSGARIEIEVVAGLH